MGTLGGRFTTIEGLLTQIMDELQTRAQFSSGDSATENNKNQFKGFLDKLSKVYI